MGKKFYVTASIWESSQFVDDEEVIEAEEIASFETLEEAVQYLNLLQEEAK